MFDYSIFFNTGEDTKLQPRATGSGDSSGIPSVTGMGDSSGIPGVSGASMPQPPAAAVRRTGRVLTRAVLESQQQIVRAIDGINDRLDQLIGVLTNIGDSINALVNK